MQLGLLRESHEDSLSCLLVYVCACFWVHTGVEGQRPGVGLCAALVDTVTQFSTGAVAVSTPTSQVKGCQSWALVRTSHVRQDECSPLDVLAVALC